MLASNSRLGLDIEIDGNVVRNAKEMGEGLAKVIDHAEELNLKYRQQKQLLNELKVALVELKVQGASPFTIAQMNETIALQKQHIALTRSAVTESNQSVNKLRTMQAAAASEDMARVKGLGAIQAGAYAQEQTRIKQLGGLQAGAYAESEKRAHAYSTMQAKARAADEKWSKAHGKNVDFMTSQWTKFETVFRRVLSALASFVVINAGFRIVTGFFGSLISSNQLLEVFNARLEKLVGRSSELRDTYAEIQRFTITTPFKVQEVVAASISLKAFGQDILQNLRYVGDWAAGVGKDLNDTAIAFAKIINYSPRTSLLLTTRGLSKTAFDLYVSIYGDRAEALRRLIDDSFGGTAKRIADTFEGILSNLNDIWVFVSQKFGKELFRDLKSDLQIIYDILKSFNSKDLSGFSEFILFVTKATIITTFATAIGFLAIQFQKLGVFLTSASIASAVFLKGFGGAVGIGTLLSGYLSGKKFNILSEQEQTIENLKEERRLMEGVVFHVDQWGIRLGSTIREELDARIKQQEEYNRLLEDSGSKRRNELMLMLSQKDVFRDFTNSQTIKKLGLQSYFGGLQNKINIPGMMPYLGEDQSIAYGKQALRDYLNNISKDITPKEALAKLKEDLTSFISKSTPKDARELAQVFATINEYLEDMASLIPQITKKEKDFGQAIIEGPKTEMEALLKLTYELQDSTNDLSRNYLKFKGSLTGSGRQQTENELTDLQSQYSVRYAEISKLNSQYAYQQTMFGYGNPDTLVKILGLKKELVKNLVDQLALQKELMSISTDFNEGLVRQLAEINLANQKIYDTLAGVSVGFIRTAGKGLLHEMLFGTTSKDLDTQLNDLRFQLIQVQQENAGIKIIEDEQAGLLAKINELEEKRANIVGTILMDALQKATDKLEDVAINLALAPLLEAISNAKPVLERIAALEASIAELKISSAGTALFLEKQITGELQTQLGLITTMSAIRTFGSFDIGAGAPTRDNSFPNGVPLPISVAPSSSRMTKNVIQILGPIYGYDDFTRKVGQAQKQLASNIS